MKFRLISCLSKNECPKVNELMRQEATTHIMATKAKSYECVSSKIITIDAIGAPITDADKAAIPAKTSESPRVSKPIKLPKTVNMPPTDAPKTSAGENTPQKT